MDGANSDLRARLLMLRESIPTADRRRTARGRMRTCRALTEHLALARQLYSIAETVPDRVAVDALIDEIDRRRSGLSMNGALASSTLY